MSSPILQSDVKKVMEQLTDLTNKELDETLGDETKIIDMIAGIDDSFLKQLEEEKENIIAQNSSMAEYNLLKEPQLVEGREKLCVLYEELNTLNNIIDGKTAELKQKGGQISLETVLALLQTAASEMEEESDKCAKKFLDSEIELENFLDEFQIKRKLMHSRLVKADKMSKILQSGDVSQNYVNAPPVNINRGFFSPVPPPLGNVPYPTGPFNMPMPGQLNYFQNHF